MNLLGSIQLLFFGICIFLLLPAKVFSQHRGTDLILDLNTPGLFYWGDLSKNAKNAIGLSLTGRFYLSEKIAVNSSFRYDNFNYKPLNKRVGDYTQIKTGITYFDNLAGQKLSKLFHDSTIKSYIVAEGGLGFKLNRLMIGNKTCFAYSIGYGVRLNNKKRIVYDLCYDWVSLKLAKGITASWLDCRVGFGYRLGK